MKYVILKKDNFDTFISQLAQTHKVVAPVSKGNDNYSFEDVRSGREISVKYIPTILPPKKYFMPQYETLLEYDSSKDPKVQAVVELEDMVIFGVHTCDLAGIQCLNTVFADRPKDINYLLKKNRITIIGLECYEYCDQYASCALMGNELPNGGYDLFFTDLGEYFLVHVNTYQGDNIIEKTKVFEPAESSHVEAFDEFRRNKRNIFKREVEVDVNMIPALFDKSGASRIWEEIGERCLSCGNCTNVCPTCYCFDVVDEPNLDMRTGKRIRVWDSCQNERFAKVSGGESFRQTRAKRKKHRFYRKFRYPVERHQKFFCTGCGRCSRTCMAKINLKETLEALVKENS